MLKLYWNFCLEIFTVHIFTTQHAVVPSHSRSCSVRMSSELGTFWPNLFFPAWILPTSKEIWTQHSKSVRFNTSQTTWLCDPSRSWLVPELCHQLTDSALILGVPILACAVACRSYSPANGISSVISTLSSTLFSWLTLLLHCYCHTTNPEALYCALMCNYCHFIAHNVPSYIFLRRYRTDGEFTNGRENKYIQPCWKRHAALILLYFQSPCNVSDILWNCNFIAIFIYAIK